LSSFQWSRSPRRGRFSIRVARDSPPAPYVADDTYDVFVSYSRADGRHAAEIDSVLRDKGLKTFFDRRNLAAGLPWVRALEQAIGAAKAAIVLIGPPRARQHPAIRT
jgi:TIR domain